MTPKHKQQKQKQANKVTPGYKASTFLEKKERSNRLERQFVEWGSTFAINRSNNGLRHNI